MKIDIETPEYGNLVFCIIAFIVAFALVIFYWFVFYEPYAHLYKDIFSILNLIGVFFVGNFGDDIIVKIVNFLFILSPLCFLIGIIYCAIKIKKQSEGGKPVLKTLYADNGGIKFVYKAQGNDIEYIHPYSEISSLDMTINTQSGAKGAICLQSIEIVIILQNGENVTMNLRGSLDSVYKFLDLKKHLNNFSYEICGPEGDLMEYINHYELKHKKLFMSKNVTSTMWFGIVAPLIMFLIDPSIISFVIYSALSLPFIIVLIVHYRSL